jgi:hypothetical protein
MVDRIEELIEVTALAADRPSASGAGRLHYSQDDDRLLLDDGSGSWVSHKHPDADLSDGPYLPLTAGSGKALTGDLYIHSAADPRVHIAEGGDPDTFLRVEHNGTVPAIKSYSVAGITNWLYFDQVPADGTSAARIRVWRNTNTSGARVMHWFVGDGTSSEAHALDGGNGRAIFCKNGSSPYLQVVKGDIFVDDATDPSIYLREGGDGTNFLRIYDEDDYDGIIEKVTGTGNDAFLNLRGRPADTADEGSVLINYGVGACAEARFRVYGPSNSEKFRVTGSTGQIDHFTGNANFCQTSGSLMQNGTAVSLVGHTHVVANITDFDPSDYLPLTAGSSNKLTGDLYFDNNAKIVSDTGHDLVLDPATGNVKLYGNADAIQGRVTGSATYYDLLQVDASNRCVLGNTTLNTHILGNIVRIYGIHSDAGVPDSGNFPSGSAGFYYDSTNDKVYVVANTGGGVHKIELT